jgi:hypothetical protein
MNPSNNGRSLRTPFVALSALLLVLPNGCGTTIYGRPSDETYTASGAAAGTAAGGTVGLIAGITAGALPGALLIGTAAGAGIGAGYGYTYDEQRHELELNRETMKEQNQKINQQQREIERLKRSLNDRASLKRPSAETQPAPMMTASYIKEGYNGSKRAKPMASDAVPIRTIKAEPQRGTRRVTNTVVVTAPRAHSAPAAPTSAAVGAGTAASSRSNMYRGREWLSAPSSVSRASNNSAFIDRGIPESSSAAKAIEPPHGFLMPPPSAAAQRTRPPQPELSRAPKTAATITRMPPANQLEPARKNPIAESDLITTGGNDDEMALGEEVDQDEIESNLENSATMEAKAALKPSLTVAAKARTEPVEAESFILDEESTEAPTGESSVKATKTETKKEAAQIGSASTTASVKRPSSKECTQATGEAQRASAAQAPADQLFYLRRALRLCPADSTYHVEIGKVFTKLGKTDDAKYEFRQAIDLDPSNESAREQLSQLESSER